MHKIICKLNVKFEKILGEKVLWFLHIWTEILWQRNFTMDSISPILLTYSWLDIIKWKWKWKLTCIKKTEVLEWMLPWAPKDKTDLRPPCQVDPKQTAFMVSVTTWHSPSGSYRLKRIEIPAFSQQSSAQSEKLTLRWQLTGKPALQVHSCRSDTALRKCPALKGSGMLPIIDPI